MILYTQDDTKKNGGFLTVERLVISNVGFVSVLVLQSPFGAGRIMKHRLVFWDTKNYLGIFV